MQFPTSSHISSPMRSFAMSAPHGASGLAFNGSSHRHTHVTCKHARHGSPHFCVGGFTTWQFLLDTLSYRDRLDGNAVLCLFSCNLLYVPLTPGYEGMSSFIFRWICQRLPPIIYHSILDSSLIGVITRAKSAFV